MVREDDLARGIRKVLKGEKYGLEAKQIVGKLGKEIDFQEEVGRSRSMMVAEQCKRDPLVVTMDGTTLRYRLVSRAECKVFVEELDEVLGGEGEE